VKRILDNLEEKGVKVFSKSPLIRAEKRGKKSYELEWNEENKKVHSGTFNTLVLNLGRKALTGELWSKNMGIDLSKRKKVLII
jgi:pyruvate/2-oxoglutarate dehydrogenase complex dihydrolipoamide dehydrogenase (E3) component